MSHQKEPWKLWDELRARLEQRQNSLVRDGRGHYLEPSTIAHLAQVVREHGRKERSPEYVEKLRAVLRAMRHHRSVPMDQAIVLRAYRKFPCLHCGKDIQYHFDGQRLWTTQRECAVSRHPTPFVVELNVPSGAMVLIHECRDLFSVTGLNEMSTLQDLKDVTNAYAHIGCAHAYVGNSPVALYRHPAMGQRGLTIVNNNGKESSPSYRGEHVGNIISDTRWFWLVDSAEYVRRGGSLTDDGIDIVPVDPGIYQVEHRYYHPFWDTQPSPDLFTLITWARPPDPIG